MVLAGGFPQIALLNELKSRGYETVLADYYAEPVAKVSEELGLPCYIDYKTALNVTNKQYMKKVFVENNISTAKHVIMATLDVEKIKDMQFPLIVKPVDCNSSKGVKKVENIPELEKAFSDAVLFSRTNTAIVEEFIEGEELSVDVYIENGKANVLSVSSLDKIANNDKFVIFRGRYSEDVYNKVHDLVRGIA